MPYSDKAPLPARVWNRIPDDVRGRLITLALDRPELSPRELAITFTDAEGYFVSESSVYRLLKAHDLITSPAFIVMKAASEFKDKTTAINQMWQTDFTYLKIIGWGCGVHPELWTNAMLGFPQSEENRGEEESLQRRTDCIDTARSRIEHGDGHGASAWGGRANDLSMAAAVLRHGGIGCPRAEAITR